MKKAKLQRRERDEPVFESAAHCKSVIIPAIMLAHATNAAYPSQPRLLFLQDMGYTSAEICSPEVAKCLLGRGKLLKSDPSMDMWALGCILYQLTTHRWGFAASCML